MEGITRAAADATSKTTIRAIGIAMSSLNESSEAHTSLGRITEPAPYPRFGSSLQRWQSRE
jgi:hypothetical protein